MPDRRTHRGRHPEDARLFSAEALPDLCRAAGDLAWLLSRRYASASAQKLVGDRYQLTARQRTAVARCVCSDHEQERRQAREVEACELRGRPLWLDGYNVLTTVEAALAGGVLLLGRDGACRDMASMHGSFRKVSETRPALELIGREMAGLEVAECRWFLDRPVSNSGRLKGTIEQVAAAAGWPWAVELVADPDAVLARTDEIIATADSAVLDRCAAWYNLARTTIAHHVPQADVLDFVTPH